MDEYFSSKKTLKYAKLLLVLALFLYTSDVNGSLYNVYSKHCYKPENSEVIWNITFNDTRLIHIQPNEMIIMQTRTFGVGDEWRDLKNCTRHAGISTYSIKCEIDSSSYRILFDMRILLRNEAKSSSGIIYQNLYLYQDGFNCFPAHGIQNLTVYGVTSHSANISWNFYSWDVQKHLLTLTKIYVHKLGEPIFSKFHYINKRDVLSARHQITGLQSCVTYKAFVINEYISPAWRPEQRNSSLLIKTICRSVKLFTDLEVAIIIIFAILTIILMSLLGYFFYRQKANQSLEITTEIFGSIIDFQDLIYDSKIKPREDHDYDIRPRDHTDMFPTNRMCLERSLDDVD